MDLKFNNLTDLLLTFNTEEKCKAYFEQQRWGGKVTCPHCNHPKAWRTTRGFMCAAEKTCGKKFTVTSGTIFENTKIGLQKWIAALYLFTAHKRGVSSCQLARDLGVTQTTAWFMEHRIREMFTVKEELPLKGVVEADETYFGGKVSNMHVKKRKAIKNSSSLDIKTGVVGLVERGGKLRYIVIDKSDQATVVPLVVSNVEPQSILNTDSSHLYNPLKGLFQHDTVNHTQQEFVRGTVHTNTIEGAFSQIKRGIIGTYFHVSSKHLHRYCDEFSYRYNTKEVTDAERTMETLKLSKGRLTYKQLTANG